MDGEGDDLMRPPPPPRPLNVMLANPRENGILEFLAAIREGNLDEVRISTLGVTLCPLFILKQY